MKDSCSTSYLDDRAGFAFELGKGESIEFDLNTFHFKKMQLKASYAIFNHYFPTAVDLLTRRIIYPDLLVSHIISLQNYRSAFDILVDPNQVAIKIVITH